MSCMLLIFLRMTNFHVYFFFPQDEKPSDDRKIFVGGLSWETRDAQLKEYFEKFGEVETVNLKLNPQTGRYVFLGNASLEISSKFANLTFHLKMVFGKK